jgi:alginate production protein
MPFITTTRAAARRIVIASILLYGTHGSAAADTLRAETPDSEHAPSGQAAAAASSENERALLSVSGHIEFDFESETNYNLDDNEARDVATLEPEIELDLTFQPLEEFFTFLSLKTKREFAVWEQGPNDDRDLELEVEEAYLDLSDVFADGLGFRFGRQAFEDDREWLYDEELDGPRIFYSKGALDLEASFTRENVVGRDLLNSDDKGDIDYYTFYGQYNLHEDLFIAAYYFIQNDTSEDDEDPQFFGVRSGGEAIEGLKHWLEMAHVRGQSGSDDIRGFGVDVGGTYTFDAPLAPRFTLGFAYGSGDSDDGDGEDSNFRQTGLQDNDDKIGGVANLHYYGEAFQPELSNMEIFTAGIGLRPTSKSSIDLVYHHYRQVDASDEVRDGEFDRDPLGNDKTLGNALDLILAYREIPNLRLELVFGYFNPGSAYGSGADDALFSGAEVRYLF